MSETKNVAKLLNPWVFHLQKLGLELKCALCLDLLNKPMLLPCNHIFCNCCIPRSCRSSTQCPVCQRSFTDKEIRTASCLENIVAIYQSLASSLKSVMLQLSSTASKEQSRKTPSETRHKRKNNGSDALPINSVARGIELTKCYISEESEVNHGPEISPGSSPSFGDAKDVVGHNSNPDRFGGIENYGVKKSIGDKLGAASAGVDNKDTSPTREPKRQKKLHYGSSDAVLKCHEYSEQMGPHSGQAAVSNFSEECKSKEDTSAVLSTTPFNGSYVNGSVCAFCQSSKITEATGRLLHYADEKEVSRDEPGSSKAIPVHSKCIEWTPQVYFVGETIKNLESELARASKLKCSSCGLKGAALGCFAKSCRKTYHVPCAVETSDCRWDFDDYVMLCPVHKSVKFPSEKSKSRKSRSEYKCSLTSKIASEELNFWSTSTKGPQKWVLCGSALSSEEKCLVVKFARICGATLLKSWDPNVTHVIAATDSNGACSRTLKVLMAILNGRWILTMDWIKACLEGNCPVSEELYEVNLDNHGCRDGPRTGRLRMSENAPKLFDGLRFYFSGDFAYKNDLLDLVEVGGGNVIESFEEAVVQTDTEQTIPITLVVYNHDCPEGSVAKEATSFVSQRLAEAEALAKCIDAQVIPYKWILESIAASQLSPYPSR